MRSVLPFQPEHLERLIAQGVQPGQVRQLSLNSVEHAAHMAAAGPAYSAFDGTKVIGCSGVITGGSPYGVVWALVSADAGRHMLWLHHTVQRYLEAIATTRRLRRIEATVEEGFAAGCRWMGLLGFEFEGRMRNYGDHGETHLRYARVAWHS